jgi:hypothetical protein
VSRLKLQTDFSEMLPARFISESISNLIESEAAIDDWPNVGCVDCPHEIRLMPAGCRQYRVLNDPRACRIGARLTGGPRTVPEESTVSLKLTGPSVGDVKLEVPPMEMPERF